MTDIFDKHPRPWVRSRGDIEDSTGDIVGFFVHYGDAEMADAIVSAVNAEPVLRERIAELETRNAVLEGQMTRIVERCIQDESELEKR